MNFCMSNEGKYIPAFFQILLDFSIDDFKNDKNFSSEKYATFVHEYIHFLQDITTASGISRMIFIHKTLQAYLCEAASYSNKIPYIIDLDHIDNYIKEKELESYYNGYDIHKKIHHIDKISCEKYEFNDILEIDDIQYVINIYHNGNDEPYVFGRDCIIESMAYLIEKRYGAMSRKNEFPYNSCEAICESLYPELLKYPAVLVAMCELSLMHYNSGLEFYMILMDMKKNNNIYSRVDEFEREYVCRCDFLWENYYEKLQEFIETINYLYPKNSVIFGECNTLLNNMLEVAKEMRVNPITGDGRLFISRIMESPELMEKYKSKLYYVLIIDKKNDIRGLSGFQNMMIPYAILRIFSDSKKSCALYKYCLNSNSKFVDDLCLKEPWKKSNGRNDLCPFAAFWHMFSLDEKIIADCS